MSNDRVALVVEDEVLVRILTADILAALGWTTVEAGDADEAIATLDQRSDITLLVVDISMPTGMDGIMLARAATARRPGLPILIVSGRAEPQPADLPPRTRFLPKPFSDKGFGWAVDEVLAMPIPAVGDVTKPMPSTPSSAAPRAATR